VWALLAALLLALDVYLVAWRWSDVGGNIEAQFVIVTPAFLLQHLALRRHVDKRHAQTEQRLDAQDEALAAAHTKVAELHQRIVD
jgi:membrane protein implicated in regulation of membrane protease activity